ncbi:Crossover junction endonuclease [Meyerozyma sp. JA9]|nr:Crossover junction endonuclease [Meyerozyma sp. JA9]
MEPYSDELNPLFVKWLEEAAIVATKKGTKAAILYNKALDKVKNYPSDITTPKQLRSIQFVGDKTVALLTNKLRRFCEENGFSVPEPFAPHSSDGSVGQEKRSSDDQPASRKRAKRAYIPRRRSGGYAILIGLYIGCKNRNRAGLRKQEIIDLAAPYCEKSFSSNPANNEFYSAWTAIKVLESNDLVASSGRAPRLYSLTEEGEELARKLKQADNLTSSPTQNVADFSFDNEIRVSPENSRNGASSPLGLICPSSPTRQLKPYHDTANKQLDGVRYDIWEKEEFEIILIIDSREVRSKEDRGFFQNRLKSLSVNCESRALSVGDAVWVAQNKRTGREVVLNHICERKRLDDLVFSIRDGRFQEQKNRLKQAAMKHYYYLVEEGGISDLPKLNDGSDAVKTAIATTMTNSNFYLKRFKSVDDTLSFFVTTTEAIKNHFEASNTKLVVLKPEQVSSHREYANVLTIFRTEFENRRSPYECVHIFSTFQEIMSKSGMRSVKELFLLMLMAIRGVSLERALTIQTHFQCPRNLIEYYKNSTASPEEKKHHLFNLFKNEVGNKKVGKVVSERIYEVWGDCDLTESSVT